MWNVLASTAVILLHGPDGHEILINPSQVTHLHAAKAQAKPADKVFTENVRCMVNLADGKFVTVVETCAVVQRMLEEAR